MKSFRVVSSKMWMLVGIVLLAGGTSQAANYTWTGAHTTEITDPANWTPVGLPAPADTFTIPSGKTVTGSTSSTPLTIAGATVEVGSVVSIKTILTINGPLTMNGATWSGEGDMTVNGPLTLTNSTWAGKGKITVNGTANVTNSALSGTTFTVNNAFNATDSTLSGSFKQVISSTGILSLFSNGGTGNTIDAEVANGGIVVWSSGNLVVNKAFKNQAGATVRLESAGTLSGTAVSSLFENSGSVKRSKNAATATINIPYTNVGTLDVETGTLEFAELFSQTSGECNLNGGKIKAPKEMKVKGGKLGGTGIIDGNVVNEGGNVAPGHSPGSITINGNYTQTANGTLNMEIAGLAAGTQYDQLIVNGTASLAGTLNLTLLNGFVPADGDNFQLLTYYSAVGSWASYTGFAPTPDITFAQTLTPTYFIVTAQASLTSLAKPAPAVDSTPPTVSITSPTSGLFAKVNPTVAGTAADEAEGSGLASTTIALYRYAAGTITAGYWNGTAWDATYNAATHERAISGTAASWTFTLPTLADGKYSVRATAKDKSGNAAASPSTIFTIDKVAPATLTVSSPVSASWVNSLDAILGTATDNTNGSGFDRVELSIKRNADNLYWGIPAFPVWVFENQSQKPPLERETEALSS